MLASPQKVALFGATGTAGRGTATALRDAGHQVTALGRRDPQIAGVRFVPSGLDDSAALAAALAPLRPDAVISCLASRSGAPADAWAIDHAATLRVRASPQIDRGTAFHPPLGGSACKSRAWPSNTPNWPQRPP